MPATPQPRRSLLVRSLSAGYAAALAALTLSPQPDDKRAFGWVRRTIDQAAAHGVPVTFPAAEAIGNVLLFVPFGLLAGLLAGRRRWWLVLLAGSATSAAIETVQRVIPGRWTTLQDWVLNTLGTGVGLVVLLLVERAGRPRRRAGDDEGRALDQDPAPSS